MKNFIGLFLLFFYYFGISQSQFVDKIYPYDIKEYIYFLASDTCAGRNTGTYGQKVAANYIRKHFQEAGLSTFQHQGDSLLYFQRFNVYGRHRGNVLIEFKSENFTNPAAPLKPEASSIIQLYRNEKKVLRNGTSFLYYGSDVVHDYRKLKVQFVRPTELNSEIINDTNIAAFLLVDDIKQAVKNIEILKSNNNLNIVFLCFPSEYFKYLQAGYVTDMLLQMPDGTLSAFGLRPTTVNLNNSYFIITEYLKTYPQLRIIACNSKVAEKFFNVKREKLNKLKKKISTEIQLKANYDADLQYIPTENVLGYVEGTTLKDEVIVVGAHYDHIGVNAHGICRGADDNASGTAALMAIAKTFADAAKQGFAPKRSILFIAFTGEEKGLYGSSYYVANPWFPLHKTKYMLNMDMVGRCNKKMNPCHYSYILAVGQDKKHLKKVAKKENRQFKVAKIDWHPGLIERLAFTFGSDHYNFKRKGISNMVFTTGFRHPDYHTTRDIPEKINFETTAQIAKLVFITTWRLANE